MSHASTTNDYVLYIIKNINLQKYRERRMKRNLYGLMRYNLKISIKLFSYVLMTTL